MKTTHNTPKPRPTAAKEGNARTGPACSENGILGMSNAGIATKRKQGAAKARVMWTDPGLILFYSEPNKNLPAGLEWMDQPVAVISGTLKQSRKLVAFARLTEEEKVERVAKAICDNSRNWPGAWDQDTPESAKPGYRRDAVAILREIGLLEEGK